MLAEQPEREISRAKAKANMSTFEEEQQQEKKRQGEGCEIEDQKRQSEKKPQGEGCELEEDTKKKPHRENQGRESEEEEEPKKNPQGEGCELKDPKKKPHREGQGSDSEDSSEEDSSEEDSSEEKKIVVDEDEEEEEEVVFENVVVVYLDEEENEEDKRKKIADDHDFLDAAYPIDRNHMYQSAMNKPCLRGFTVFDRALHEDIRNYYPERKCDTVVRCAVTDHDVFRGSPIFDLFRVELYLKNSSTMPLSGKLYGTIESYKSPENPQPISYFCVKKENAIPFTLKPEAEFGTFSLPLSGPKIRPAIVDCRWFYLNFALRVAVNDEEQYRDVFEGCGQTYLNPELFAYDKVEAPIIAMDPGSVCFIRHCAVEMQFLHRMNDDFGVAAFVSSYYGAWATFGVEIKKKGISGFYGFIFARSCVLPNSRMYLLSIDEIQKCELQQHESVHPLVLTRKVLSAPTCSSLIIVAELWDQDGEFIVKGKTFFPAKPEGIFGRFIGEDGVGIDIKVKWKCKFDS